MLALGAGFEEEWYWWEVEKGMEDMGRFRVDRERRQMKEHIVSYSDL